MKKPIGRPGGRKGRFGKGKTDMISLDIDVDVELWCKTFLLKTGILNRPERSVISGMSGRTKLCWNPRDMIGSERISSQLLLDRRE